MKADLLYSQKDIKGEYIRQMIVWRLEKPVLGCSHCFKYRFYFGTNDGTCLVRYDNERGKGDHKHIDGKEVSYLFKGLKQLFSDFSADIEQFMEVANEKF